MKIRVLAQARAWTRLGLAPLLAFSLSACDESADDITGAYPGDSDPQTELTGSSTTSDLGSSSTGSSSTGGSDLETDGTGGNACEVTADDDACQACTKLQCCELTQRCADDAGCNCGVSCLARGGTLESCTTECPNWAASYPLFLEIGLCSLRACPAECADTATGTGGGSSESSSEASSSDGSSDTSSSDTATDGESETDMTDASESEAGTDSETETGAGDDESTGTTGADDSGSGDTTGDDTGSGDTGSGDTGSGETGM